MNLVALVAHTYGWTHKEIMRLGVRRFLVYVEQAARLEARKHLLMIEACAAPYTDGMRGRVEELQRIVHGYNEPEDYDTAWRMLRMRAGRA